MFNTKNLSPGNLAFFTALCLSVPIGIAFYIISVRWIDAVVALVVVLIFSYFLIRYVLNEFIYRKIKVIYKYIYQTKATKREETYYKYIYQSKPLKM